MIKICAIIPSRYNSKRLPGKPLLKINSKEILFLTYSRLTKFFDPKDIYIFTESNLVKKNMKKKMKNIHIVKGNFKNGTERSAAGMKYIKKKYNGYMIISCDNPYVSAQSIKSTIEVFKNCIHKKNIACTTVHTKSNSIKKFNDKSVAKVVLNKFDEILYLSRSPIPSMSKKYFFTHHGPVCIKENYLKKFLKLKSSKVQNEEDNEWLKFIYNGYIIKSKLVSNIAREINTKRDLNFYRKGKK